MSEPIDPDVDLHDQPQRTELRGSHGPVLAAVSVGGGLGALTRYGVGLLFPSPAHGFPVSTFLVNIVGCFLIGVLMVLVSERVRHPLARPFAGTGFLGGFTTFSTAIVDGLRLLQGRDPALALVTLFGTLAAALVAVWAAVTLTRRVMVSTVEFAR